MMPPRPVRPPSNPLEIPMATSAGALIFIGFMGGRTRLYVAYRTMGAMVRRWGTRWGFSELSDVASLPLVLVLVGVISLVTDPLTLAARRRRDASAAVRRGGDVGQGVLELDLAAGRGDQRRWGHDLADDEPAAVVEPEEVLACLVRDADQVVRQPADQLLEPGGQLRGRPARRCSWMMRSRRSGVQEWYQTASG